MNYGHQAVYDTTLVERDFSQLKASGVTKVRIAFPPYNGSNIANCQDMVTRALAHGFYVVWGVSTGASLGQLTATTWAAYKSYVTSTLVPYAQSNSLPELCIGNECDFEADGVTLLASTVQADIRAMCASIKSGGYTGLISYNTSTLLLANWIAGGIGSLDLIGWNSYDTFGNFTTRASSISSSFGTKGYISEFGSITSGFGDYASEEAYYIDVLNRIAVIQASGIPTAYFFCYRDGGFGVPLNSFSVMGTNGLIHFARQFGWGG